MNIKTVFSNPKLLTLNGITLEVFEAGQQNNNPIVLCHGWPQHAYSWRHQISALVEEGYHVIIPNQRGYGQSSSPSEVTSYDIKHLTGDLIALLDYYNYNDAIFIGHDWGAMIVWSLSLLYPDRVKKIINLSVPYQERGDQPWIEFLESLMGTDNYFVHFNRHPGVADTIFNENTFQFLRNLYRKDVPTQSPKPGMALINLARETTPYGEPLMNDYDLSVFVNAFQKTGFTGSINWYRNLDRNWYILENVDPIVHHPALMIYGEKDPVSKSDTLEKYVPNVEVVSLDCGHWIQEEKPFETNHIITSWLRKS